MMRMRQFLPDWAQASPARPEAAAVPLRERLRWSARHGLKQIGWPGVVAIGLVAVCPAFYLSAVLPAQHRLDGAQAAMRSLQQQIAHSARSMEPGPQTATEQLAEFYRMFPAAGQAPQWLEKLAALAEQHGLVLEQGEYAAAPDKLDRLLRYQITLPLKGDYLQIRKFLLQLPASLPIVALESVQFQRQKIADPVVEARIRLVLYLGVEP